MCKTCNCVDGHFEGCPFEPTPEDLADPYRYYRIERQGMTDEGYWAAVNGTDFNEGGTRDDH